MRLGVSQGAFEDMIQAIEREGHFEIGHEPGSGIPTIDREYSLDELGLTGLDQAESVKRD